MVIGILDIGDFEEGANWHGLAEHVQVAGAHVAVIFARLAVDAIFFFEDLVQCLVELLRKAIVGLVVEKQVDALVLATGVDMYFYKALIINFLFVVFFVQIVDGIAALGEAFFLDRGDRQGIAAGFVFIAGKDFFVADTVVGVLDNEVDGGAVRE